MSGHECSLRQGAGSLRLLPCYVHVPRSLCDAHCTIASMGEKQRQVRCRPCVSTSYQPHKPLAVGSMMVFGVRAHEPQVPFTPRRWRPSDPDTPQVPFTFALRPAAPASAGKRGRGGAGEQGSASGRRARVRKLLPSAWTTGEPLCGVGSKSRVQRRQARSHVQAFAIRMDQW